MNPWETLHARYDEIQRAQRELEQSWRMEVESRRVFDAWSDRTTRVVMKSFLEAAAMRSVEFERQTGARVLLKYPAHHTIGLGEQEASMRFLEMHLDDARMHFYSFAESGRFPRFYFMPTQAAWRNARGARKYRTMISLAACHAEPIVGDGYQLRVLPGMATRHAEGGAIGYDDLTYRAFSMLVDELERIRFRNARRPRVMVGGLLPEPVQGALSRFQ